MFVWHSTKFKCHQLKVKRKETRQCTLYQRTVELVISNSNNDNNNNNDVCSAIAMFAAGLNKDGGRDHFMIYDMI